MSNVPITHAALLTYPGNLCLYPHSPIPKADSSGGSQTSMRKGAKPDCHSLGPAAGIAETGESGWPRLTLGPMQQAGWGHPPKNTRTQKQFAGFAARTRGDTQSAGDKGAAPPTGAWKNNKHKQASLQPQLPNFLPSMAQLSPSLGSDREEAQILPRIYSPPTAWFSLCNNGHG